MPPHVEESLQRGALMSNNCDRSAHFLKRMAEDLFCRLDPGAKVSWMILVPQGRYTFAFNKPFRAVQHSVLLVDLSDGRQLILDPTGEQFGIPREHRFLPAHEYMKRYMVPSDDWEGRRTWILLDAENEQEMVDKIELFWKNAKETAESCVEVWVKNILLLSHSSLEVVLDSGTQYMDQEEKLLDMFERELAKQGSGSEKEEEEEEEEEEVGAIGNMADNTD
ncbi:uncharacterized protein K460DRAFT_357001 [Cucurbitaria berberidis CBS 394.84]|uniref:Uncharacterized protein n=1 Tax=Cucurbitaria berberidis CBS 394.84 TaxID=1168544 RepID=A0A9P4L6F5_9PLEO|nr:uncharacterized protein K460DRAFT_357001 [Cucurbitaria berberidis CBS 394.84]KAF1843244.1 hypothetical protein K460DRAFT_357001 [Cucurbitaria berberidis CBS 394.84]